MSSENFAINTIAYLFLQIISVWVTIKRNDFFSRNNNLPARHFPFGIIHCIQLDFAFWIRIENLRFLLAIFGFTTSRHFVWCVLSWIKLFAAEFWWLNSDFWIFLLVFFWMTRLFTPWMGVSLAPGMPGRMTLEPSQHPIGNSQGAVWVTWCSSCDCASRVMFHFTSTTASSQPFGFRCEKLTGGSSCKSVRHRDRDSSRPGGGRSTDIRI